MEIWRINMERPISSTETGSFTIEAPPGSSEDTVMKLAADALAEKTAKIVWNEDDMESLSEYGDETLVGAEVLADVDDT